MDIQKPCEKQIYRIYEQSKLLADIQRKNTNTLIHIQRHVN